LTNKSRYNDLHNRLQILGIKINNFLKSLEKNHNKFDD